MTSLPVLDDIPVTVTTIVDLRALVNHRNNEIVRVRSTENDFRFSSSSFAVDDGISVVRPINVSVFHPGRWLVIVYPVNINVGAWSVIFTRKVVAGVASDGAWVDTGLVYDNAYEYYLAANSATSPSPAITTPSVITTNFSGADSIKGLYKPDGATPIAMSGSTQLYIPAVQSLAALGTGTVVTMASGFALGNAQLKVDAAGKFWSKWTQDNVKDAHFVIARRQRYG